MRRSGSAGIAATRGPWCAAAEDGARASVRALRRPLRGLAAALLISLAGGILLPSRAALAEGASASVHDAAAPRWDQYGGNPARTFASAVEPVRGEPRVAWTLDAPLLHPVVWEGTVYAAVPGPSSGSWSVRAVALEDGRVAASLTLPRSEAVHLATNRGILIVATDSGLFGYQLQKSGLTRRWTVKGRHAHPPSVVGDTVYSVTEAGLVGVDGRTGNPVGPPEGLRTRCAIAHATDLESVRPVGVLVEDHPEFVGRYAFLATPRRATPLAVARFRGAPKDVRGMHLMRIPFGDDGVGAWLLYSPEEFAGAEEDAHGAIQSDSGEDGLALISYPPTVHGARAIGFRADGLLVSIAPDGRFWTILEPGQLPGGARPGPASRARSTAYFGNWALDLDTSRVLWSLPDLGVVAPLYPVADRTLLAVTAKGTTICLTDRPPQAPGPGTAAEGAAGRGPAADATATAAAPGLATLPDVDGLLLRDGTCLPGTVIGFADGSFRVTGEGGASRAVSGREVLLARSEGRVLHRGSDAALLAILRGTLHPRAAEALMTVHGRLAKLGLHEASATVLADARAFGLAEDAAAAAGRRALGTKANPVPDRTLASLAPWIVESRLAAREPLLAAAESSRAAGFLSVAACLLMDARRMHDADGVAGERAAATVPPEFPFDRGPEAVETWLAWAPHLAAADAAWVAAEDPVRRSVRKGPWAQRPSLLVLRTPNTIFRTPVTDAATVGRCLRNAEFTCTALTALVGNEAVLPVTSDGRRMDVRLHADRASYLAESDEKGRRLAPEWSAGYFSPDEGVSRFYVPGAEEHGDPLGRGLFEVLAHELTHHFLETRWTAVAAAEQPPGTSAHGYWAVEGIARFVEDQVVEMDRRGLRFDDRTVPSLDATAQAMPARVLFPVPSLTRLTHREFLALKRTEILSVRLRNTLTERSLSDMGLFYEQSGALAYFVLMERGPEGRAAFFRYLADVYGGRAPADPSVALGFPNGDAFDGAFRSFLAGLR